MEEDREIADAARRLSIIANAHVELMARLHDLLSAATKEIRERSENDEPAQEDRSLADFLIKLTSALEDSLNTTKGAIRGHGE